MSRKVKTKQDLKQELESALGRLAEMERCEERCRRLEVALHECDLRFRRLVENAGEAFYLHDISGNIIDVNQRACASLGSSRGRGGWLKAPRPGSRARPSDFRAG